MKKSKIFYVLLTRKTIWFMAIIFSVLIPLLVFCNLNSNENQTTISQNQVQKKFMILVDVENCRLYLFENGTCTHQYVISPGAWNTPSPLGLYKIIAKDTWGEGFGGSWLGFNCPWGSYGIHGSLPYEAIGYHESHGCIRMKNDKVRELYNIVPYGTKILIVDGPYGPFGQGFRTLKMDDQGSDVLAVQKRLKKLGFYKYYPDGVFGPALLSSIHKFQASKKLYKRNIIGVSELTLMGFMDID